MIFIFRKKKVVIDCFTPLIHVYNYAPIELASKHIPDWWKQLPKHGGMRENLFTKTNMKSCYGLIDLYKSGIIIPLWSDIRFLLEPNGDLTYQYSDQTSTADFHDPDERKGWAPPNEYAHIKLVCPWLFKSKEDVNWVYVPPMYNQSDLASYTTCTGILNFKYQRATNVNLIFPIPKQKKLIHIDHGHPLIHAIPLTDKRIEVRNHLVTEEEYKKINDAFLPITFNRKYEKILRIQKSKCPF